MEVIETVTTLVAQHCCVLVAQMQDVATATDVSAAEQRDESKCKDCLNSQTGLIRCTTQISASFADVSEGLEIALRVLPPDTPPVVQGSLKVEVNLTF